MSFLRGKEMRGKEKSAAIRTRPCRAGRTLAGLIALLSIFTDVGCSTRGIYSGEGRAIRVSDFASRGDAARRASTRLVIQGLDADVAAVVSSGNDSVMELRRAQGSYERAIQVDPTNPYAYLALARHHLDGGDATQAANLIDQSAALFEAEGLKAPEVDVQLIGLRGLNLEALGRTREAAGYLDRAKILAPGVWGDGYLSAEELR